MTHIFSGQDFALGIVAGSVATVILSSLIFGLVLRRSDAYSLGHWKLNLRTPLTSMWMNLGYWTDADGKPVQHFDQACLGLLKNILEATGSFPVDPALENTTRRCSSVAILDLGFGCGDQTQALLDILQAHSVDDLCYVGLTLDRLQLHTAVNRLRRYQTVDVDGRAFNLESIRLFRADAALPDSWSNVIKEATQSLSDKRFDERWLLALDCLYHFSPSRRPIFQYAAINLGLNLMAFDLVLNDYASHMDRLSLRIVALMMGCPVKTFLTQEQYCSQLVECGYDQDTILIRDISNHVFAGVANFLRRQDEVLSKYGTSIGGFKLAGRLFSWFDRSRVRAVIVGRLTSAPRLSKSPPEQGVI